MSQPPNDPWDQQPQQPPGAQPPWQQPQPGGQQPAEQQPGAQQQWPGQPGGQQPWPGQPGGQQPWPGQPGGQPAWPGQPVAPPPYGWMTQSRFDPSDPLVSDDYSGWWRRSIAIMRKGWRQLALLQLLFVIPILAFQVPAEFIAEREQRGLGASLGADTTAAPDFGAILGPLTLVFAAALVAAAIYTLGTLATMRMVAVIATGGRPSIGAALGAAARRVPAMIGWYILAALLATVALLACLLPVVYVAAALTILPAVVLFERGGAIPRCFRLFHADFGASVSRIATIFGLAIAMSVVVGMVTFLVTLAVQGSAAIDTTADVSTAGLTVTTAVSAVLNGLTYLLAGVVGTPLIVTAYADMRARHEPFSGPSLVTPQAV